MSGLAGSVVEGVDVAHRVLTSIVAQAAAPAAGGGTGIGTTLIFLVLMLAVFYLVMWRPQSKQYKAHQAMIAALKRGDEVVLLNGILGKIHEVGDRFIVLEVARDVRIRVIPSAITAKIPETMDNAGTADSPKPGKDGQDSQNK